MPINSPFVLMSAPPELPGLIDASVWMKSSYGPSPITRPLALMMPVVTVCSRPYGLPIAMTDSPTSSRAESPRGTTGSPLASTFRSTRSVRGSRPSTVAGSSRPSASVTRMSLAPSTTWLLVTMNPSGLITKPEPRLFSVWRRRLPSTRVVLTLTTAGLSARASATHGDAAATAGWATSGPSVHSEALLASPGPNTIATDDSATSSPAAVPFRSVMAISFHRPA